MILSRSNYKANCGAFIGIIADVIELYGVEGRFGKRDKIRIIWVLDANDSTGKPYRVIEQMNASLNGKTRLYEIVKGVLGAPPSTKNFDTETLMGKANQLFIIVERGEDGKYAHIKGILPVPPNAVIPKIPADFVRFKDKQLNLPAV
jgi:hypothetical protein